MALNPDPCGVLLPQTSRPPGAGPRREVGAAEVLGAAAPQGFGAFCFHTELGFLCLVSTAMPLPRPLNRNF